MPVSFRFLRLAKLLPLAAVAAGLLVVGCGGGGSESEADDVPYEVGDAVEDSSVALIVSSEYGTDTVGTGQFRRQVKIMMQRQSPRQRSDSMVQEMHGTIVRGFARRHVLRGEAAAQNITADSAQVNARLSKLRQRYQSEQKFRQQLARNNLTIDSVRAMLATQFRQRQLQQQMAQNYEEPTAEDVASYSQENRRIRAQHILIEVGQNAPQTRVDSARQAAEALVDSAQMENVDFAELARRHSDGPSADRGGDLGYFTRNQMVSDFSDAAYALSDSGDVAPEPVRTQYGFHVIRLTDPGEPMDTTRARQQMRQERQKQAVEDQVNELLEKVTVRANPSVTTAGLYEE